MAEPPLRALLHALSRAETAEQAAEHALSALLESCAEAASQGPYRSARMLRAAVHLRPDDAYAAILTRAASGPPTTLAEGEAAATSATAWRHLQRWREPVAVDVQLGAVSALGSGERSTRASPGGTIKVDSQKSLDLMTRRETTHLLALPLWGVGRRLCGMVTLEADCRRAVGRPFLWSEAHEALDTILELSGPYLTGLPLQARAPTYAHPLLPVVGEAISRIVRFLRVFAQEDECVLLQGPTGTGKSRIARWCHAVSPRADQPFVALDLNAIQPDLQRAELFGWERGAFTGAVRGHDGAVARAEGGTLFLDEVDKLTLASQASLLQLLEERRYLVMGDDRGHRQADVRFIVGTNADLRAAIAEGRFLSDLYYRINVLPVRLPPLSERPDEIGPWASYMASRRAERSGQQVTLDPSTIVLLTRQPWPGNLRQLDNILRRAVLLALVDHAAEGVGSTATLTADHVATALQMDAAPGDDDLLVAMEAAAARFVRAARRLSEEGRVLDLDHVAALRGMVLNAAVASCETPEAAFALLGKEGLVASRNHQRALKNALQQVEELRAALEGGGGGGGGGPPKPPATG